MPSKLSRIFWYAPPRGVIWLFPVTALFYAVAMLTAISSGLILLYQLSMMALGLAALHYIARMYYADNAADEAIPLGDLFRFDVIRTSPKRWYVTYLLSGTVLGNALCFVVIGAIALFEYFLNTRELSTSVLSSQSINRLFYYIFLIALVEEIWFRGVLFWAARRSVVLSVVVATIIFAAIHYPSGGLFGTLVALGIGSVYAALRFSGASIPALAVGHGFLNWFLTTATVNAGPSAFGRAHWAVIIGFNLFVALIVMAICLDREGWGQEKLNSGKGGENE